jgi:hypothetical protein
MERSLIYSSACSCLKKMHDALEVFFGGSHMSFTVLVKMYDVKTQPKSMNRNPNIFVVCYCFFKLYNVFFIMLITKLIKINSTGINTALVVLLLYCCIYSVNITKKFTMHVVLYRHLLIRTMYLI